MRDSRVLQPATLDMRTPVRRGIEWLNSTDSKNLADSGVGWWDGWGYGDVTGRMVDAYILARQVVGEEEPMPGELRTRTSLLSLFSEGDGLSYRPKPHPVAHMFDQSSVLFGMVSWLMESGSSEVADRLEKLVGGLWKIAEKEEDFCHFPLEFYSPGGWKRDYLVPRGLPPFKDADPCHEGGRQILPLVRYHQLSGSQTALRLARGLARFVMHHAGVFEPDGSFREKRSRVAGHVHSRLATVAGVLKLGLVTGEAAFTDWARMVFDWALRNQASTFGWVAEIVDKFEGGSETCGITDAIETAIMLGQAGYQSYWNVAERFARNHLLEAQCSETGGFAGHSMPNDYCWIYNGAVEHSVAGCCAPAGVRALFLVWDNTVTETKERVQVNLALNRGTRSVDVESLLPHRGEVKLTVKVPLNLAVRVPDWVEKPEVEVAVNGALRRADWAESYVTLRGLQKKDVVLVKYPLRKVVLPEQLLGHPFEVRWRGDTVISVTPEGIHEPLYQRREMDTDEVPSIEREPQKLAARPIHW